jgi:GNAT superfamily N-acetyltransferase
MVRLAQTLGLTGNQMRITISLTDSIDQSEVIALYKANQWSSAEKPDQLIPALRNSHSLVTARVDGALVGLANAISDGHLVAYFPHMLVHPNHQRQGIGRKMMLALLAKYEGFHQLMLTADGEAVLFYESMGFSRAGKTVPMWVYSGTEH